MKTVNFGGIEIFGSDFAVLDPIRPRMHYTGMLDTRWIMTRLGLTREVILEWVYADPEGRKFLVGLIRQVSPGFMNRAMRRAVVRTFNEELTRIYNNGMIPVLEIDMQTARRLSDFRAG